jgi:hypothetical protein
MPDARSSIWHHSAGPQLGPVGSKDREQIEIFPDEAEVIQALENSAHGELASGGATTRAEDAGLQILRNSSALPVHPFSRLQDL